jgi:hypothetical protein
MTEQILPIYAVANNPVREYAVKYSYVAGNWRLEGSSTLGRNVVLTGKQLNDISEYRTA